jgi:hypothetical protein
VEATPKQIKILKNLPLDITDSEDEIDNINENEVIKTPKSHSKFEILGMISQNKELFLFESAIALEGNNCVEKWL